MLVLKSIQLSCPTDTPCVKIWLQYKGIVITKKNKKTKKKQDHCHKSVISCRMKCKVNITRRLLEKKLKKKNLKTAMVAILFFKMNQNIFKSKCYGPTVH